MGGEKVKGEVGKG